MTHPTVKQECVWILGRARGELEDAKELAHESVLIEAIDKAIGDLAKAQLRAEMWNKGLVGD